MHRHGISHALGYIFCSLVSGVIVDLLKRYYPKFNIVVTSAAMHLSAAFDYRVSPKMLSITFVACVLAFIWGIGFKLKYASKR